MYKTKLQELCHQRRWGLPRYSALKDGPDHMPSFKASVFVNGVTFTSSGAFSSSKEAHNQAAMLAFLSFSSGSSTSTADYDIKDQIGAAKPKDITIPGQFPDIIDGSSKFRERLSTFVDFIHYCVCKSMIVASDLFPFPFQHLSNNINRLIPPDMDRLCKKQLQNYAQKNNLDPPVFTCKTEGPPHTAHFKATVLVNGQSFESPSFFNTIKEAEQAAAKVSLMSLSLDIFQKARKILWNMTGHYGPFKTLLLKLTQREGLCKPTYKTIQSGSLHMPTFFSTVEVESMEFHGKGGRSKKQAEQDAAKIAYIALKECGVNMYTDFSPSHIENNAVEPIHSSDIIKCKQNLKLEDELLDLNEILPANVKVNNEMHNPSYIQPPEKDMMNNRSTSSCEPGSNSSPKSSPFSQLDASCVSISESSKAKSHTTNGYLLCNRYKVYTCFPNIPFPEGIIVLPISDNKWVAVSLEFPNDKDL
ncbi:hypothetical protein VNO77_42976 [Canavalia gladiata]|uniref:DRBM domain-containing protein n=1 Tax=Canavalia gladiata TaxID=3824 RepID=A0AAN9JW95_CANGL